MLQVRLLGQFDVRSAGKRIDIPSRAGQSLLAYLLLNAGTPQRRERLAGLLWPDTSDENARHNLRTELWRIRKALGSRDAADHDYLLTEDLTITFNPDAQFWLDVNQLQRPTSTDGPLNDLIGQLTLYQGELLPGFYDDWIVLERERLQAVFERDMKRLLERLCEEQRWATVLEWSERWIALGQTPEPAYRALMAAYAALGDRAKAVATYERCQAALEQELGVEPSPETRSLYDRLLRGEAIGSVDLSATQIAPAHAHLIEELPAPGDPPFKGLQYFDEADADLFFGREVLTAKLIEHLHRLPSPSAGEGPGVRFLAVIVGASGSGKSSIVRAGLIPALKHEQPHTFVHVITPTAHPLEALATALTRDSESVTATATLLDDLAREPRSLALFSKRLLSANHSSRLLLVIDQFEELFTLCRDEFEREAFIDNLLTALTPAPLSLAGRGYGGEGGITLILTLRADFYAHLAQYPELRDAVAQQQEYIGPMTADELRRAIEEPARRSGWEFEPGLVDLMLRDVGDEPGVLPLLSHALLETWQRRSGRTMTLKGYADAGGVRGAIAYTAETVYQQLSSEQQDLARHIFLELTDLGEGTEDTRRRVKIDDLVAQSDQARPLLTTLADARLITTSEETVEVAHEALIREWPRLRDWLNENRDGLRLHRHLSEAAHDWELLEHDPGALYRGARLSQANEWAVANENSLSAAQRAFLAASNELEQHEAAEREAQRQRELQAALTLAETQQQSALRLRRRNRVIVGAGMIALLLAVLAGLFGAQAQAEAQNRAMQQAAAEANFTRAEAQRLAGEANNLILSDGDVEQAALLSLRSLNLQYTPQGDIALAAASRLNYPRQIFLWNVNGWVLDVAFSPDGRYVLLGTGIEAQLWNAQTGQLSREFGNDYGLSGSVAFSPDGRLALTGHNDATVALWDVETGQLQHSFNGAAGVSVSKVTFSPDGETIIAVFADGQIRRWKIQTGELLQQFTVYQVGWDALSPDGRYLAATAVGSPARLWDMETGQMVRAFGQEIGSYGAAFSPDGKYLVVGSWGTVAHVWEVETGREVHALAGHTRAIGAVAFSPDGRYVLTGSEDRTARLWDVRSGNTVQIYRGHTDAVKSVAFTPDGQSFVTGSADFSARLWDIHLETEPPELIGHTAPLNDAAFSSNGRYVLTSSNDRTARLWDAHTGQPLHVLAGHEGYAVGAAFSPDSRYAVTTDSNLSGTVRLWNVQTGDEVRRFTPPNDFWPAMDVAISPDGKYALVGYARPLAGIWELSTGKLLDTLTDHTDVVDAVAISPDGRYALTGSWDGLAILWTFPQPHEVFRTPLNLAGHIGPVKDVAFSPDGKFMLTGSTDKLAILWDTQTGELIQRYLGHTSAVNSVDISPNGKLVATGSSDGTARLWNTENGKEVRRFDTHASVSVVRFLPDGKSFLIGDSTGVARIWDVDYHTTMQYLCSRLLRDFTDDERKQYGIADKAPTCSKRPATQQPAVEAKPYIPVISKGFYQAQFWLLARSGTEKAASELNVDTTFEAPALDDVAAQLELLQVAIDREPAAICFAAIDSKAAIPLLEKARAANIPVIAFDSGIDSDIPAATVATDNIAAAAAAADKMAELIGGSGEVAIIAHDQISRTGLDRVKGFTEQIKARYPNITIVATEYGAGGRSNLGYLAKTIILAHPNLKGFFGTNELAALEVLDAVQVLNAGGKLVIIGFDATKRQKDAIRSGLEAGAIAQDPINMGYQCIQAAVKASRGESLPKNIDTGFKWYDKTNMDDPAIAPLVYD
jgi:WD40 repeat protein/ABC-type sugar transport system substrate-binding protein/DNA-binding SARP family transcriptional activator